MCQQQHRGIPCSPEPQLQTKALAKPAVASVRAMAHSNLEVSSCGGRAGPKSHQASPATTYKAANSTRVSTYWLPPEEALLPMVCLWLLFFGFVFLSCVSSPFRLLVTNCENMQQNTYFHTPCPFLLPLFFVPAIQQFCIWFKSDRTATYICLVQSFQNYSWFRTAQLNSDCFIAWSLSFSAVKLALYSGSSWEGNKAQLANSPVLLLKQQRMMKHGD